MLAEANVPNDQLLNFFGDDDRMHLLFNFAANRALFLAVAQERSQFIDRLALQPARIQIPAYVLAFLALELFAATGPVPFVYFQF